MSSAQYPLEQLAVIKQKKLEEAEKHLQEKKNALLKEEEKLLHVEQERDKVKLHREAKLFQLREKLDQGTTTDKIQQMKVYLKEVEEKLKAKELKVKDQKKHVDTAEKKVEEARKELLQKQTDVEKLRLHKKEWEKEMKALIEYRESTESDELGSSMHVRKKHKPAKHPSHRDKKK